MVQIHPDRRLSFSLPSQKAGQKQQGQILAVSAQLMALVSALRSLSSVALSSARVSPVYHPFLTPLRQGDISTLQNRGHLYFALTGGNIYYGSHCGIMPSATISGSLKPDFQRPISGLNALRNLNCWKINALPHGSQCGEL